MRAASDAISSGCVEKIQERLEIIVVSLEERRETVARALVSELEARFPYAAALLSGAAGMRVIDSGQEQNANEESPSRGVVFTVYDGASFVEFASGETEADRLASAVRA